MKSLWCGIVGILLVAPGARGQTFPAPDYFHQLLYPPPVKAHLAPPQELHEYVVSGKLRLTLDDAIKLALLNNTNVQLDQLQIETQEYALEAAYSPFDPLATSTFSSSRNISPATNTLQGASTVSSLFQDDDTTYSQTFETGTNYTANFTGSKGTTNSVYYFLNPYLSSDLSVTLTQPLLRNRGFFANRAPIVIAQRTLDESRQTFEAQVSDLLQHVITDYWTAVGARENLNVAHSSLAQAQASYNHDKRSLQLGALSPLDIYQSESQVAQVKVNVIQVRYQLQQAEEQLRQDVGADLDPAIDALDLDLAGDPRPQGQLLTVDPDTALQKALAHRPELAALNQQFLADEANVRYQHNQMLPNLELSGNYASSGVGGDELLPGTPAVVIPGGFGSSLSQLFHFHYPTYGLTLTLTLPIRNHAAEAALGQAAVSRKHDLYSLREEKETVHLDVVNAVHELEDAKLQLGAAVSSRDLAEKNLQAQQEKYRLGTEQVYFVLAAQTALAAAENSLVQAEITYQLAVADLAHAEGTLLDAYNVHLAPAAPSLQPLGPRTGRRD